MSPGKVRVVGWIGVGIIVLLNLLVLIFLGSEIYSAHRTSPLLIQDAKGIQDTFDTYKDRVDAAQKLVTALIGLSSLYALALGFTTFLAAQQYLQALKDNTALSDALAKSAVERIDGLRADAAAHVNSMKESQALAAQNMEALRNEADGKISEQVRLMRRQGREARLEAARERVELQKQFPLFGSIDKMFSGVLSEMRFLSVAFMVDFDEFDEAAWRAVRVKIMFYERAFAGFDLLDAPGYERQIIDAFGYLGRFYRKNFLKTGQKDDLYRARFYSEIAVKKSGRRYMMLNNFAATWLDERVADELRRARELASESLDKRPKQQRALYILAWIDDEEGNFPEAASRLEQALGIPVWEDRPDRMTWAVHYNFGCALSKVAAQQENKRDENLDKATHHLKIAVAAEGFLRKQFEADLTGDLQFLASARPQAIADIRNV